LSNRIKLTEKNKMLFLYLDLLQHKPVQFVGMWLLNAGALATKNTINECRMMCDVEQAIYIGYSYNFTLFHFNYTGWC